MPPLAVARRVAAALFLAGLIAAARAKAGIEKFMRQCDGKLCGLIPRFRSPFRMGGSRTR